MMDIKDFLRPLRMDVATVQQLSHEFYQNFEYLAAESLDQFLPTPITESILRPTAGSEKGKYLAIDIGGTNLRVGFIELLGNDKNVVLHDTGSPNGVNGKVGGQQDSHVESPRLRRVLEKSWPILEHLKNEKADALFQWIGVRIAEVVRAGCEHYGLPHDEALPLGVTFSFPMVQQTLSEARLMSMGKGFQINSELDLGTRLSVGYAQVTKGLNLPPIKIVAIANDSVATLVSFIYQAQESARRKASMGLICGTGCNATIPLRKDTLHPGKVPAKVGVRSGDDNEYVKVAVNTEWTINGTAPALYKFGLVSTWDKRLDAEGDKPGFQPLEYMTSGRYLGELARLVLLDYLHSQHGHDLEALPARLLQRFSLTTTFLSHFKPLHAVNLLQKLQAEFPAPTAGFQWTEDIALALYHIAKAIEVRGAGIIAAATMGLLACAGDLPLKRPLEDTTNVSKQEPERGAPVELVVGYTGGCIVHFQDYLVDCQEFLDQAVKAEFGASSPVRVVLDACHDSGITGAGVLAGSALARSAVGA